MANKWQLQMDLSQYENLKNNLKNMTSNLNSASESAAKIGSTLGNHYNINENGNNAIKRSDKLKTDISDTSRYISDTIIPAINKKIEQIKEEIRREEEREEEERRKSVSFPSFWW